jgi:hypothetical protein
MSTYTDVYIYVYIYIYIYYIYVYVCVNIAQWTTPSTVKMEGGWLRNSNIDRIIWSKYIICKF